MAMGSKVFLAVAAGYALGRTRKMKLAITIAGLLAGRRIATDPKELLRQSVHYLESSPELQSALQQLRGQLVDAGKAVATASVANQVESISDRIEAMAANVRGTGQQSGETGESSEESGESTEPRERAEEESEQQEQRAEPEPEQDTETAQEPSAEA